MSLKARLRGAIVALVTAVVVVMSLLYLSDFTKASFSAASDRADLIADQFHIYLENHLKAETATLGINPASLEQWEDTWTAIIRQDPDITEMLNAPGQSGPGAGDSDDRRAWQGSGRLRRA